MLNPIFVDLFVKVMNKLELYNPKLDFSSSMINGKSTYEIFVENLKYVDKCANQIEEMDSNTYAMLICCLIAQKHMCKFDTWNSSGIYKKSLSSKFADDKMLTYFEKIDEAFEYMGYAFACQGKEYIDGFCSEFDFFQSIVDWEQRQCYLNSIVEAISICPQFEYAYCFLVVEYSSMFMGTLIQTDDANMISEYYCRAYQILDDDLFNYIFTGELEISYPFKKIIEKYKGVQNKDELNEEQLKEYCADMEFCKKINEYTNYLSDKKIVDGCVRIGEKKYKIGIPFSKFISVEEKESYLANYFVEEPTQNFCFKDEVMPYSIHLNSDIIYRDEEKTYRAKVLQNYRGFSYYMPKVEFAPLKVFPFLTSFIVRELTKTIMKSTKNELESQRKVLSMQNQLDAIRRENAYEVDEEIIVNKMEVYYEQHKEEMGEARRKIFEKGLEQEFGKKIWNSMPEDVRKMLISAEISYNSLQNIYGIDYSPAIIPLTKAVEYILNIYLYQKGIYQYLKQNDLHKQKDYTQIYHLDKKQKVYCPNDFITMGQAAYMFERYETYANGMIKIIFKCNNDKGRLEVVEQIKKLLKEVVLYRNEMAHMHGVSEEIMQICREKIVYAQISLIKNIFRLV